MKGMRKTQEFIVYPISVGDERVTIQSDTRFGMIDMKSGVGKMTQSHANGAYGYHMIADKLVAFKLDNSQLIKLKMELVQTSGKNVGSRGVLSDNEGAKDMMSLAEGGEITAEDLVDLLQQSSEKGTTKIKVEFNPAYDENIHKNVSDKLIGEYIQEVIPYEKDYNHGWQYGFADEINIDILSPFAKMVCPPSQLVLNKSDEYAKILEDRTAILYRGNDKGLEIARTPYTAMEEMAKDSKCNKFLVQTDEEEFYQYFKDRFPDTICFDDIPRINKNPDSYVMPEPGKKANFAINFLAALIAISKAKILIINTGNTGHWATIFRGNINGIYQWHGNQSKWKKF